MSLNLMLAGVKPSLGNLTGAWLLLPTVIRENDYDSILAQVSKTFDRMEELDHAIEWAIIRAIEKGSKRFAPLGNGGEILRLNSISPRVSPPLCTFFLHLPKPNVSLLQFQ